MRGAKKPCQPPGGLKNPPGASFKPSGRFKRVEIEKTNETGPETRHHPLIKEGFENEKTGQETYVPGF